MNMNNKASEIKRSTGKGQIIHTSLKELTTVEPDFPNSEPTPGVLARAMYHHANQKVVVEIYHESPLIISPGKGEFIDADPDTVDNVVRSLIINIASKCRTQGEELLQHADRLLEIASQENIIDEIDKDRIKEKAGYVGGLTSVSKDISTVSATSSGKSQPKQKSNRVKNDDLLSMLADDDEEDSQDRVESTSKVGIEEVEDTEDPEEDENLLDLLLEED